MAVASASRVAVLSDIHGNLPALEAVLADVDAAGADLIVLPGDMTVGPLVLEILERLAALGDRAVWVRGNCERYLVEVFDGSYRATGAPYDAGTIWCGRQLTQAWRDRLADGRRFVNPGSVGMPYGPPGTLAYWALLGPDVTLRRTAYDLDQAAAHLRTSAWPGLTEFIDENLLAGPPSDAEALALFTRGARNRRGL